MRWAISTAGRLGHAVGAGTVAAATQAVYGVARDLRRNVERGAILAAIRDLLVGLVRGQAVASGPGPAPGPDR